MSEQKTESMTVISTDNGEIKLSPKIIKQFLVRGNGAVTDQETMMFLSLCKFQKLNPFLNEAYLVKFGSQPANIIVGKETFTKRAFNHPKFKGLTAGIIIEREGELLDLEGSFKKPSDTLLGGWAIVHVEGRVPFKATVSLEEYDKKQSTWKQIPCTMIRKVALVQALREAFPDYFQAMYSQEEMDTDNNYLDNLDKVQMSKECVADDVSVLTRGEIITLYEIGKKHGFNNEEVKALMNEMFCKVSSKNLTVDEYLKLIAEIKKAPREAEIVCAETLADEHIEINNKLFEPIDQEVYS